MKVRGIAGGSIIPKAYFIFFIINSLIFSLARSWFLLFYVKVPFNEIGSALWMGLRFDLKVMALILLLFIFIGIFCLTFKPLYKVYLKTRASLLALVSTIIIFIAVSNYYYLVTYNSYIDIFAFSLFDGNTKAILLSIWEDYPVFILSLLLLLVFAINLWAYKKPFKVVKARQSSSITIISSFFIILVLLLLARGSLGTFPLRQNEVQVSNKQLINASVPNGLIALHWANKDRKNAETLKPATDKEGRELFSKFFQKKPEKNRPIFEQFFTQTKENNYLAKNPPNVFLGIMESMSTHLLSFHDKEKLNLTGALQIHLDSDFLFKRFVSSANGTEPSLAHLLFNSPMAGISHSKYQKIKLATSIAKPYKDAGYKTVYVTAGSGSWKNLGTYLLRQYFDEVIDQNTIKQLFPQAKMQTWGSFDEWGLKAVEKVLLESKKPVFIVFLSITNHPPFEVPEDYQPYSIQLNKEQKKILKGFKDPESALISFQYANDSLGKFMTAIKNSPIGPKTIMAFTGDHNARSIAQINNKNKAYYYGVPFLVSVPKNYQGKLFYDKLRVGSHKDIAPTLYNLSLSSGSYINLGKSMLGPKILVHEFGVNEQVLINKKGLLDSKKSYLWEGETNFLVESPSENNKLQGTLGLFVKLKNWLISKQL